MGFLDALEIGVEEKEQKGAPELAVVLIVHLANIFQSILDRAPAK